MFLGEAQTNSYEVVDEPKPRRGRKPKQGNELRSVKLSIYLTSNMFEATRDLAALLRRDVSSVVSEALKEKLDQNAEKIAAFREFLASMDVQKEDAE